MVFKAPAPDAPTAEQWQRMLMATQLQYTPTQCWPIHLPDESFSFPFAASSGFLQQHQRRQLFECMPTEDVQCVLALNLPDSHQQLEDCANSPSPSSLLPRTSTSSTEICFHTHRAAPSQPARWLSIAERHVYDASRKAQVPLAMYAHGHVSRDGVSKRR
ncbi:uncharacterized protein SETTUDRAFT_31829 [Exserohilum turcica Et28A]|uniref:Uncharacterized protein n=1 Tax=Exserohilum turcicum (strain 28A) TaxID=671987 RepID=R0JU61_EXST2|nr:uncharacterized protein SETTUDRAFT_31829 [Exserohilum turcica Et28A]EOA84568.1 hypothetical protein SETTUDRAFT_31829 [Exserohilum turcica Et28A]